MSICNQSDIDFLYDDINNLFNKFVNFELLIGGVLLVASIGNMYQNSIIITKLNQIKTTIYPPLYKVSDA